MDRSEFLAKLEEIEARHKERVIRARARVRRYEELKNELQTMDDRIKVGIEEEPSAMMAQMAQGQRRLVDPTYRGSYDEAKREVMSLVCSYIRDWE